MTASSTDAMSIGALTEAIIEATELGGAWGGNMHESKDVLVRVGGTYYPLAQVSCGFVNGSFCLILQGGAVTDEDEDDEQRDIGAKGDDA